MSHSAGKGSRARPLSIDREEFDRRWQLIFGRDAGVSSPDHYPAQDAFSNDEYCPAPVSFEEDLEQD
jgi:hypothetical protein